MSSRFHPVLINDPFGDPGVYVEFMHEKRALLFDLGDLRAVPPRKLLRVHDVFVSHMHLDHFCGFDQLLRTLLGRDHELRLFGPQGFIEAVASKLAAYTWNLVGKHSPDLVLTVGELIPGNQIRTVRFRCRHGFQPEEEHTAAWRNGTVFKEESFRVSATILDHGIPCLGYALEEKRHVNVWGDRLAQRGLRPGPWLRSLKEAILRNAPGDTAITATWREGRRTVSRDFALRDLRGQVADVSAGVKIVYVVDNVGSRENIGRIVDLARDATVLFIEAAFLHEDEALASDRHHLTARQAGTIARQAHVQRLITLHYSSRYEDRPAALAQEAETWFRGPSDAE